MTSWGRRDQKVQCQAWCSRASNSSNTRVLEMDVWLVLGLTCLTCLTVLRFAQASNPKYIVLHAHLLGTHYSILSKTSTMLLFIKATPLWLSNFQELTVNYGHSIRRRSKRWAWSRRKWLSPTIAHIRCPWLGGIPHFLRTFQSIGSIQEYLFLILMYGSSYDPGGLRSMLLGRNRKRLQLNFRTCQIASSAGFRYYGASRMKKFLAQLA